MREYSVRVSVDGTTTFSGRDLLTLPKAHLHLHLEGAMRLATMAELARGYGVPAPATRGFTSFTGFLDLYRCARRLVRSLDDLRRVVREVVEDAAADGAVWVEPAFYPPNYRWLAADADVMSEVLEAGRSAAQAAGIGFGLMVATSRTADRSEAEGLARLAVAFAGRGVVALGLANDENASRADEFATAFALARSAGLLATPHAGELAGAVSVWQALDLLGADRVQHGVRAVEDPELLRRLADQGTCLDVCPTSNVRLGLVPVLAEHPLPRLLAAGVRCSINADDPLLFGVGILSEYETCRSVLGLGDGQLGDIARTSIEASGAPDDLRRVALDRLSAWRSGGSAGSASVTREQRGHGE